MTQLLLKDGNVADPANGNLLSRHDVLIENDRIVQTAETS